MFKKFCSILLIAALLLPATAVLASDSGITVLLDGEQIQFDVTPIIYEGRTLVGARSVFEAAGASVSYDEITRNVNISYGKKNITICPWFSAAIINGEAVSVEVPPIIVDGRTMIPLRFIGESLGFNITYTEETKTVSISTGAVNEDVPEAIPVKSVTASGNDGNLPENTLDGDYETRWSAEGRNVFIEFELEKATKVGYVGVAWYEGESRLMTFDIYTSLDGENYTQRFSGSQEEFTRNMTAYDLGGEECKYIKLFCRGNTENMWNSMTEIKFYPPLEDGKMIVEKAVLNGLTSMNVPQEVKDYLLKFDNLLGKDVLQWIIDLYDPETGGFYYTKSGMENEGFLPDIEATGFAMSIINDGGLLDGGMPEEWKEKLSGWLLNLQDPDDGYFYLPQWGKTSGSRRDRDLSAATSLLNSYCRKQPLYLTPQERLTKRISLYSQAAETSEYLTSKENCLNYLDEKDWSTAGIWATGNSLSSAKAQIIAAGLLDTVRDYIIKKQNPETGLWGEGLDWMNINGTMKLSSFFDNKQPFPNVEKAFESVLYIFKEVSLPNNVAVTYIWNPIALLERAFGSYAELPDGLYQKLLDNTQLLVDLVYENALLFKREDGGFSQYRDVGVSNIQGGVSVGLGNAESDMDATVIISQRLRTSMYNVLGLKPDRTYYRQYSDWFFNEIANKPKIVKKETATFFDFESDEIGAAPNGWNIAGDVAVARDPNNPLKNKCLKFTRAETGNSTTSSFVLMPRTDYKTAVFSCKILLADTGSTDFFYNTFGGLSTVSGAVQWLIRKGNSLGTRRAGNVAGESFGNALNSGEWYDFRIEYTPKTFTDSVVKYYIDDELVMQTHDIYRGSAGTATEPVKRLMGVCFTTFREGTGTFYIDDVNVMYINEGET